jgi:large-conductance mechanosensitive channel
MMILIRFILISLIVYLIIRSFIRYSEVRDSVSRRSETEKNSKISSKGVSKEIGEYIDYEEVKK